VRGFGEKFIAKLWYVAVVNRGLVQPPRFLRGELPGVLRVNR